MCDHEEHSALTRRCRGIRQVVAPAHFPSGDRQPVAELALAPGELADRYSLKFGEGEDGLDYFRAAAIEVPSGQQLLLLRYRRAPTPGTIVYADAGADPAACRKELLQELGLTEADLTWWPEAR
jgi:hypothetical protein